MGVQTYRYHERPTVDAMQIPEADDMAGWGELAGFLGRVQNWEVASETGNPGAVTGLRFESRFHPPGDWVVRYPGDRYKVLGTAQFRSRFDPEPVIP